MTIERPDLEQASPEVLAYIEALETELAQLKQPKVRRATAAAVDADEEFEAPPPEPTEPPTSVNIITISTNGYAKRTPRHFYTRQRRGGMGVFDLDAHEDAPPALLVAAEVDQHIIVVTNQVRAFRFPVADLAESLVRDKGISLEKWLPFRPDEKVSIAFPDLEKGYLILLTERGHIRRLRYHYFGTRLRPGTVLYNLQELGIPVSACWSTGEEDLFIATKEGKAIRFAEKLVPANGCLGVRLGKDDSAVAITPVNESSQVFMMSADGKGTIRLMNSFASNKAAGTGGKTAMKTDQLIGALEVKDNDNIFAISRLSKIIRFQTLEIPVKEGVVQGVNCMALRSDETVAIATGIVPQILN